LNRELQRRTNKVGSFPDNEAALMLVAERLRYVLSHQWGTKRYMSIACPERVWSRCWKGRLNPPYRKISILWANYSGTDFPGAIF
jgi:transposase-like protein